MKSVDVLIAGCGPAGMAAAVRAAESGKAVTVLDDNPAAGGQIWRGGKAPKGDAQAAEWFLRLSASNVEILHGSRIIGGSANSRTLRVETQTEAFDIGYTNLILATGARELFLPFPGWTLPNIMGIGGLQAIVKGGLPVHGKRIVLAGSGPLLLAVAAYLRKQGVLVVLIAEQAPWKALLKFGGELTRHPGKLWQAAALKASLGFTSYLPGSWVEAAEGTGQLESIQLRTGKKISTIPCDYLATAYGFVPNTELPQLLGCSLQDGYVAVDRLQQTSIPGIFCAGEITGLGGVDLSLVEGEIAGYAATGQPVQAQQLAPAHAKATHFATALNLAFTLRPELHALPNPETIVCRCEDIDFETLKTATGWRSAKLHLRCGMGPCQGRICGPAVNFLLGWNAESIRPPVFPARVSSLIEEGITRQ